MKGTILKFDPKSKQGTIRGEDDQRFFKSILFILLASTVLITAGTIFWSHTAVASTWQIEQITDGLGTDTEDADPRISGDNRWIAFSSTADYTNQNGDGSQEIFLYNIIQRQFLQITHGDGSTEGSKISDISYGGPFGGPFVTFRSADNLTGQNGDQNREIFLFDLATNNLSQLTITQSSAENRQPLTDAGGHFIVFQSTADLNGQNPAGSMKFFLLNQDDHTLQQIITNHAGQSDADISGSGHWLVFESKHDLISGSNSDLSSEVFLYNLIDGTLKQVSSGIEDSVNPNTNFDGRYVVFVSSSDLVPSGNPNNEDRVFLYDLNTGVIRQLSFGLGADYPTINNDSSRIVFQEEYDGLNGFSDVILYDLLTDTTTKISNSLGTSEIPVISGDGKLIVFLSISDFTGGNPDGSYEIFLAHEVEGVPLPGTFLLISIGLVGLILTEHSLGRVKRNPRIEGSA